MQITCMQHVRFRPISALLTQQTIIQHGQGHANCMRVAAMQALNAAHLNNFHMQGHADRMRVAAMQTRNKQLAAVLVLGVGFHNGGSFHWEVVPVFATIDFLSDCVYFLYREAQ